MSTIQKVLFPIDFSLSHRTLTATMRQMFDRPKVEIILMHVIENLSQSRRGTEVERAMAQMEFLARKDFAFASVRRRVERGRAADSILDYARRHAPDIIIMRVGGTSSFRRSSLGRVTEEVLTGSPCAVWLEWMTGARAKARRVCCALRLDESDETVLCPAAEVARELGVELTIIHTVSLEPELRAALRLDPGVPQRELRTAQVRLNTLRERVAPEAGLHIEVGKVHQVVSGALYRLDAALLVTAGQREVILAAETACPVLRVAAPAQSRAHAPEPNPFSAIRTRTA